jgi:hypothetical protein
MRIVSSALLLALILTCVALVLLNPALLIGVVIGVLIGAAIRWGIDTVRRPRSTADGRPTSVRESVLLILGLLAIFLALPFTIALTTIEFSVLPIVRAAYTVDIKYDALKAWTVRETYTFDDKSSKEAARLLRVSGRTIPDDASPDVLEAAIQGAAGPEWKSGLDTGQPTLTREWTVPAPDRGPRPYQQTLLITAPSMSSFQLLPATGSNATVKAPKYLILAADPPIASHKSLPQDPDETINIGLAGDTSEIRFALAPRWARYELTSTFVGVSVAGLTTWAIGAVTAALTGKFGGAVLAWLLRLVERLRPKPAPAPAPPHGR